MSANKKLFQGIWERSIEKVQQAFEEGASIHAIKKNTTPLWYAIWLNSPTPLLEVLLQRGAPLNYRHPQTGETALHLAVGGGQVNAVRLLCHYGIDASLRDLHGRTALETLETMENVENVDDYEQIRGILETCGITDPGPVIATRAISNTTNNPKQLVLPLNTDPQGGRRQRRKTYKHRRSTRSHRKSSNRS